MSVDIKTWLDGQTLWLQAAAHRLLTNGTLTDEDIADFVQLIKSPPPTRPTFEYPNIGGATTTTEELRINSIGPVTGIDALAPRTPLSFADSNLSVVYGANGSGKSGYTRILKKVAGKAGAFDLKNNVYAEAPEPQTCSFSYKLDGNDKVENWAANTASIIDLQSIDIFDTEAGEIYLNSETELSYTPPELALFEHLVSACQKVDTILSAEKNALDRTLLSPIPSSLRTAPSATTYASLRHNTSEASLTGLLTWTDAKETQLVDLKERLKTKDPTAEATRKRAHKIQSDALLGTITQAATIITPDAFESYKVLLSSAQNTRRISSESATALRIEAPLKGIGGNTWRALWEAARAYSTEEAYPAAPFPDPSENTRCVLCHQELDKAAQQRMTNFEGYVTGTLEAQAQHAENAVKAVLNNLPAIPDAGTIETAVQAAGLNDELKTSLNAFWSATAIVVAIFQEQSTVVAPVDSSAESTQLIKALEHYSEHLGNSATQLDEDAKGFDRTQAATELLELETRKWIFEQADNVRAEITRLKTIKDYEGWERKTATRGISVKAGQLSEALITATYIERFNSELSKLGANQIKVELVKSGTTRGRSKHMVKLKNLVTLGISPSGVFSEGEHRIVALAAFLADVCGRPAITPFIFDDPITSLDQRYEEKVIDRLIELSTERQVLILTHRLSFLGIMNDKCEKLRIPLSCISIRRETWGTGHVGEVPIYGKNPRGALNTLKEDRLRIAENMLNEHGSDTYDPLAKSICSDFRIVIERIIENIFLGDVIQRHRRQIKTLGREVFRLTKITHDDCELVHYMMSKYSCYEHSQTPEAPVEMPPPDDLRSDLETMLAWHDEFKRRPEPTRA